MSEHFSAACCLAAWPPPKWSEQAKEKGAMGCTLERGRQQESRQGELSFELGRLLRLMFSCHLIIIIFFFFPLLLFILACCAAVVVVVGFVSRLVLRPKRALRPSLFTLCVVSLSLSGVPETETGWPKSVSACQYVRVCVCVRTCLPVCVLVQLFWFVVHSRRRSRQSNVALCLCMHSPRSPSLHSTQTCVSRSLCLCVCVCVWRVQRYCFNHCCCFLCPRLCHHLHMYVYVCSLLLCVCVCVCALLSQHLLHVSPLYSYSTFTWILHARSIVCSFVLDIF